MKYTDMAGNEICPKQIHSFYEESGLNREALESAACAIDLAPWQITDIISVYSEALKEVKAGAKRSVFHSLGRSAFRKDAAMTRQEFDSHILRIRRGMENLILGLLELRNASGLPFHDHDPMPAVEAMSSLLDRYVKDRDYSDANPGKADCYLASTEEG